jgi:uncharacterized protein
MTSISGDEVCCICLEKVDINNALYLECCNHNICSQPCYENYLVDYCPLCRHPFPTNNFDSLKLRRIGVEKGYIPCIYKLGCSYYIGDIVEKDYKKAFELMNKAAEQGCVYALNQVAQFYETGTGVEKNAKKAFEGYTKAAEQGLASAYCNLGKCYNYGTIMEKDKKKAFEFLTKAADLEDDHAQYLLGLFYHTGDGCVEKDIKKAISLYERSVKQGNSYSQYLLGRCYFDGDGVEKDVKKAIQLLEKSAEEGHFQAQNLLGRCYLKGDGVKKDLKKAFQLFEKSAEQGNPTAQTLLGSFYMNGTDGVRKDTIKAIELWNKAAEDQESFGAQYMLGRCYMNGDGVEKDEKKAFELFKKSAEQDYVDAMRDLAKCYEDGSGVEKDSKLAFELYIKILDHNEASALDQYNVACCYVNGIGTPKDKKKSFEHFFKAAQGGVVPAKYHVALCYEKGDGVERNVKEAMELFRAISDGRSEYSGNASNNLKKMIAEDLNKSVHGISISTKKIVKKENYMKNLVGRIFDHFNLPDAKRRKLDPDTVVVKIVDYPFIVACEYGDLNIIKQYLVKHNHHPHNNNIIANEVGLPFAFRSDFKFMFDIVIGDGSFCGNTGLYYAAFCEPDHQDKTIVNYLMENGGNEMDKRKGYEDRFVHSFIKGDLDVVKYLLQNNRVDPNRMIRRYSWVGTTSQNILHYFCSWDFWQDDADGMNGMNVFKWFVNHHNIQGIVNQPSSGLETPLDCLYSSNWYKDISRDKERWEIIQILKGKGAKRSMWAVVEQGDIEGLKELIMDESTDFMQLRDSEDILDRFGLIEFDWLKREANVSALPLLQLLLDEPGVETLINRSSDLNLLDMLVIQKKKGRCKVMEDDLDAAIALMKSKGATHSLFGLVSNNDNNILLKKMLYDESANIEYINDYRGNVLHEAIHYADTNTMAIILTHPKIHKIINAVNIDGHTPLDTLIRSKTNGTRDTKDEENWIERLQKLGAQRSIFSVIGMEDTEMLRKMINEMLRKTIENLSDDKFFRHNSFDNLLNKTNGHGHNILHCAMNFEDERKKGISILKIILEEIPGISQIINQSCTDANQSTPLDLVYIRVLNNHGEAEEETLHRDCKIRIDMIQLLRKHGGKRKSEMC